MSTALSAQHAPPHTVAFATFPKLDKRTALLLTIRAQLLWAIAPATLAEKARIGQKIFYFMFI
jgi:hypothetical protein